MVAVSPDLWLRAPAAHGTGHPKPTPAGSLSRQAGVTSDHGKTFAMNVIPTDRTPLVGGFDCRSSDQGGSLEFQVHKNPVLFFESLVRVFILSVSNDPPLCHVMLRGLQGFRVNFGVKLFLFSGQFCFVPQ